jgi:hypothetical protein
MATSAEPKAIEPRWREMTVHEESRTRLRPPPVAHAVETRWQQPFPGALSVTNQCATVAAIVVYWQRNGAG